jgi:glycosyltransferase involved in cell wall biosynthesis
VSVGVVAIGRNEGPRLRACLESAHRDCNSVVYVDSGSTDGSVELAKSLGAEVVSLDLSIPFTAARARNEGFARLRQMAADVEYVQFVDGDCEIVDGWINAGAAALAANTGTAVACGRRRERFPQATIYNRLCDMEWNTPIGIAKACGGDALIRVEAFEQVGGYNPHVIAGEEPEMCVRLRERGWTIHRIDAEMTLHDAAITKFSQWWKRMVRGGHAYAEGVHRHGNPPERMWVKQSRSIWIWTIGFAAAAIVAVSIFHWFGLIVLLAWPVMVLKIAAYRHGRGDSWNDAVLYGFFAMLAKVPQLQGQVRFMVGRWTGKKSGIVEYKSAKPTMV